jgi:hypothetical protein
MARTKSQTVIDAEAHFSDQTLPPLNTYPATVSGEPAQPFEYDDVTDLANVLAELGADEDGGGFVVVNREEIQPNGKRDDVYIDRFAASEFSLENLKARWGAGRYKISVYKAGGAGLATRKVITIAKDPNAVPAAQVAQPTDLSPILAAIQKSNEGVVAAIMAMAQSGQKQPSRMDMLQEMQIMRDMFGRDNAPVPSPVTDPLALMKFGAEMAMNGAGGGEGNNAWVDKMLTTFGPMLANVMDKPTAAAPARPSLPAPVARPAPIDQPINQTTEDDPVSLLITNYLNLLSRAAQQNAPVDEYADSILAMIPTSSISEVESLLRPADWRDRLKQRTQAAEIHPVWFTALRDTLLQYIDEDRAELASTHLTPEAKPVSVPGHENADTTDPLVTAGDPASPA